MARRSERAPHWWARAFAWAVLGCAAGPLALGLVSAVTVVGSRGIVDGFGEAFVALILVPLVGTMIGAVFAVPVYLPLLLLWAAAAPRLGRVERTYGGVIAGTGLLASAGAALLATVYGSQRSPFGYRGWDLAAYTGAMLLLLWAGLVLPRLVIPALRPGAFVRTPTGAA